MQKSLFTIIKLCDIFDITDRNKFCNTINDECKKKYINYTEKKKDESDTKAGLPAASAAADSPPN